MHDVRLIGVDLGKHSFADVEACALANRLARAARAIAAKHTESDKQEAVMPA